MGQSGCLAGQARGTGSRASCARTAGGQACSRRTHACSVRQGVGHWDCGGAPRLPRGSLSKRGLVCCCRPARGAPVKAWALLFEPPPFNPAKLTTAWLPGVTRRGPVPPAPRRYTLTHNDLTGELQLSVGACYNTAQISSWYNRLIRDEVLAEWRFGSGGGASLHVHCHVSGEERWLAPPGLRDFIFRREMPLVLDTLCYADRTLLADNAVLAGATVFVHLSSHVKGLNATLEWGCLSRRETWRAAPAGLLSAWWLGPKLAGSPGAPLSVLSAPQASPQLVATRASAAVWPGADAAEVESVALGSGSAAAEQLAVDTLPAAGQAGPIERRSSAVARLAADAAEVELVLTGSECGGAGAPAEVLLQDAGVAGTSGMFSELLGAPAAPGDAVDRPPRTREGADGQARGTGLRGAAELAAAGESRSASRQSAAVGAAGQAGAAELGAASESTVDRAVPEDERDLTAVGVRVEPECAAAQCTSLDRQEAPPEFLTEDAGCEIALGGEDAQTLRTSLHGSVPGCTGSEADVHITVRDIVSEWLVNGHEVVTVRQGSARAHVLAHALVHAVGGDSESRR